MTTPNDAPAAHDEDDGGRAAPFVAVSGAMTVVRSVLVAAGLAAGGYGAWLLWEFPLEEMVRILVWAGVGVVVHDFVFAPLCAVLGWSGRTLVRGRWWTPVSVAATCTVVLALLAIPVYTTPGARPDNPTVADRNYPLGFWAAFGVVWACVPIYYLIARLLPVREDEVVDQQRSDDVEGQPPAV